jgi:DNA-directed RNA polymerase subunit RPC12/RpoP
MPTTSYPCPECGKKISDKHYDSAYEMYECPKCEGNFTFAELLEGQAPGEKAGPPPRGDDEDEKWNEIITGKKTPPPAKGKKRQELIASDAEADAKQIEEITKNPKKGKKEERHRDEVETGMVLNIIADEIELICEEAGVKMDRLNAREFFAMNLYRPLLISGHRAREQDVKFKGCVNHS